MNVLVFCAHADDEVIAMAGTLRKLANQGARIRLVLFSQGAEGYARPEEKASIVTTRHQETEAVCALLGIQEYINLGGLDWDLRVGNAAYRQVIEQIRSFRPEVIFTHSANDYNDHYAVHQSVTEGWFHAALPCAMESDPVWRHVPLYEFEVIKEMRHPSHVVDITDTFEAKQQAMAIYNSQFGIVGGVFQLMEGRAMQRGYTIGVRYGEAFDRSRYRPRGVHHLEALFEKD